MPNVPKVPGVPPLLSYAVNAVTLLTADFFGGSFGLGRPQWGLYKDGAPVIIADSVVSFDYKQGWTVADYPIEAAAGSNQASGFESYDKVASPFEVKMRFAAGGTEDARAALLASVEAIAGTLDVFDAVEPEKIYQNVTIAHYDYRRGNGNAGLIVIDLWCVEVRTAAAPAFSNTGTTGTAFQNGNTKEPSGASPGNGGDVQSIPVSPTSTLKITVPLAQVQ